MYRYAVDCADCSFNLSRGFNASLSAMATPHFKVGVFTFTFNKNSISFSFNKSNL